MQSQRRVKKKVFLGAICLLITVVCIPTSFAYSNLLMSVYRDAKSIPLVDLKDKLEFWIYFSNQLSKLRKNSQGVFDYDSQPNVLKQHFYGKQRASTFLPVVNPLKNFPELKDETQKRGLFEPGTYKGIAAEDFNNDGHIDLVFAQTFGAIKYYQNDGRGGFKDIAFEKGLSGVEQVYSISHADYDNDGWLDLLFVKPFAKLQLFKNIQGERFIDVTEQSNLDSRSGGDVSLDWLVTWADVDLDGDLDFFVASWSNTPPIESELFSSRSPGSALFINNLGKFEQRNSSYNIARFIDEENFSAATFADYNNDAFPDLFLSSFDAGKSLLLINQEGRSFRKYFGNLDSKPSFISAFLDVDSDGWLDLLRTSNTSALPSFRNISRKTNHYPQRMLYNSNGKFVEDKNYFSGQLGVNTLGIAYGDFQNDGCWDYYFGTGNPEPWFIFPNLIYSGEKLFRNCLRSVENITLRQGVSSLEKGQAAVFADIDNDGDQDFISAQGGMWKSDAEPNLLLVNKLKSDNAWVKLRLVGHKSNTYGVGARVVVLANSKQGKLSRHYVLNSGSGFGSSPLSIHAGLGHVTGDFAEVYVWWPATEKFSSYKIPLNKHSVLKESEGSCLSQSTFKAVFGELARREWSGKNEHCVG